MVAMPNATDVRMGMKVLGTHGLWFAGLSVGAALVACGGSEPYNGFFTLSPPPAETTQPTDPAAGPDGTGASSSTSSSGAVDDGDAGSTTPLVCDTARDHLLNPVDKVSAGVVRVVSVVNPTGHGLDDAGNVSIGQENTIIVDATAGGYENAAKNPRLYLSLQTLKRVDVTDVTARASNAWDIAFKRSTLFTNSGDAGPGNGGALFLPRAKFGEVKLATVTGKTFGTEQFTDAMCAPLADAIGAPLTSFDGWYQYEGASMHLTPVDGVFVVKSGTKLYKLVIESYYGDALLGTATAAATYEVRLAELTE